MVQPSADTMVDSPSPLSGAPSPDGRPIGVWLVAVAAGLLALGLQGFNVPILTQETPPFTIWQIPVLLVFLVLGGGPGLLAALIAVHDPRMFRLLGSYPGVAAGSYLYVVELWVAFAIYRRARSLPVALALFWVGVGWWADLLLYVGVLGLTVDYVAVLFVKQLMNAVLYGTAAEILASPWVRDRFPGPWRSWRQPLPIEKYAFNGIVIVVMLPVTLVGILYARAEYEQLIRAEQQVTSETAFGVATRVREHLERERARGQRLKPQLVNAGAADRDGLLRQHVVSNRTVRVAALADADGIVLHAFPPRRFDESPVAGLDLSNRAYFREARDSLRTTYSDFLVPRVQFEREASPATAVISEPIIADDGGFFGALIQSLDVEVLVESIIETSSTREVTLVDGAGAVLGSSGTMEPGWTLNDILLAEGGVKPDRPYLPNLDRRAVLDYYPVPDGSLEADLGLNLVHAVYQPANPPGWGVLVALPSGTLHALFLPTALKIIFVFVTLLGVVFVAVKHFARRLTDPVRSAERLAGRVEGGQPADGELAAMESSSLLEMRALAASLTRMQDTLHARRKENEEREESLQSKLMEAQKLEAMGLLAGGVAHDLNNMLTPVLGFADLGASSTPDHEAREYFDEIRNSARGASKLVRELLAFGRRQVLDMEPVDLVEEIRDCPRLLKPLLREDIELVVKVRLDHATAIVDAGQFHRILFNLAINAQDAMPGGGTLTITLDRTGGREAPVVVSVADTGIGMSEETLLQIFEPFFTTKQDKGTGLGLSTVYGIIQQHGGSVEVESELGEGTEFRVYLPLATDAGDTESTSRAPEEAPPLAGHVVLVEDQPAVRHTVATLLEKSGYRVSSFDSAEALLKEVEASGDPGFQVLVTDVVLPGMTGPELHRRLSEHLPDLPTIFISGYGHDVLAERGLPEGVSLLMKPFEKRDLLEQLRKTLGG